MTDLFTNTQPTDQPAEIDPNKDFFSELVGEGKKFKTPQELARAKAESDAFIERLKNENSGLRDELKTRTTLEEVMTKLTQTQRQDPPSSQNNHNGEDEDSKTTAITPEQIAKLVDEKVSQRESMRQAEANVAFVSNELKKAFGDSYVNRLQTEAQALGMSKEEVNRMAAQAPKALLRLLGADKAPEVRPQAPDVFTPPSSRVQSQSAHTGATERTKAFYDAMKKQDANRYWSKEIQSQMHRDAVRLGEKFFT